MVETTIVPQFLAEIDGVEASENVIIIGASNRPELIDPAVQRPGRLDVKIAVKRPERDAARAILALNLTPNTPIADAGAKFEGLGEITFKPHVTRRTIAEVAGQLGEDKLKPVLAALPARTDVHPRIKSGGMLHLRTPNP